MYISFLYIVLSEEFKVTTPNDISTKCNILNTDGATHNFSIKATSHKTFERATCNLHLRFYKCMSVAVYKVSWAPKQGLKALLNPCLRKLKWYYWNFLTLVIELSYETSTVVLKFPFCGTFSILQSFKNKTNETQRTNLLKFGFSEKATKFEKSSSNICQERRVLCTQQRTCQKVDEDF